MAKRRKSAVGRAFGNRLRGAREAARLSQAEAARRAAIAPPYLNQIEAGIKDNPDPLILKRLAEMYDVDLVEILKLGKYIYGKKDPDRKKLERVQRVAGELLHNESFSNWYHAARNNFEKAESNLKSWFDDFNKGFEERIMPRLKCSDDRDKKRLLEAPIVLKFLVFYMHSALADLVEEDKKLNEITEKIFYDSNRLWIAHTNLEAERKMLERGWSDISVDLGEVLSEKEQEYFDTMHSSGAMTVRDARKRKKRAAQSK